MTLNLSLDLDFVRNQFPASRWKSPFFENAGGAFVPNSVIDHINSYMIEAQVQTGYPFAESADATRRISDGQNAMAALIGADNDEVTLGASTSMNIYVLAQALRPLWRSGDEIIVSSLNHESNSGPWRRLEEFGIKIIEWHPNPNSGELVLEELESLLSDKSRLVAFPHVSNITGGINDVETITEIAHQQGALVCVDGVAYAPHRSIDVKKWDVDFYTFSFYKVFGPHLGLLYAKREQLLKCKGQYHYFFPEDDLPHKLNPAGPTHELISSLSGIADYLNCLYHHHFGKSEDDFPMRMRQLFTLIANHEESLSKQLLDYLNSEPRITLIGDRSADQHRRVPTFSIQLEGCSSSVVAADLAKLGIACGSGHFYSKRFLDFMNLETPEVLRFSMAHYTSPDDVNALITALRSCALAKAF